MAYSSKYASCNDNPLQFGVYFEETVTAVGNVITTTYPPATELRNEFLIIDPDTNTDDNEGIIGLWRTTGAGAIPVNVFTNITGVTKAGVISMDAGAVGDEDVLVKYYVAPKTYAVPFPPVDTTSTNAVHATKEIFQCLLNKCQFMSPLNLFRLGFRYAHIIARITLDGGDAPWNSSSFVKVFDTHDSSYYDYKVDTDYLFPLILTELRVYSNSEDIFIKPSTDRDGNSDDYFGELGHNYYDLETSTTVYEPGASGKYLLSVPLGPLSTNSFQVKGSDNGGTPSGAIVIEVSGYYKPLSGQEVL